MHRPKEPSLQSTHDVAIATAALTFTAKPSQICTVDAIHNLDDDTEYIMEVNGTSSGLAPEHNDEDCAEMVSLVVAKWNRILDEQRTRNQS